MSNLTNRLDKLEKQTPPVPANSYMTMIGGFRKVIVQKLEAVQRGEILQPSQDTDPATAAMRTDILQRLQRIAATAIGRFETR